MSHLLIAYGLIILGLLLLASELFLPSGGILFVLAVGAFVVGFAMMFAESTARGIITAAAVLVLIATLGPVLIHYWPKTPMGKRFFLHRPDEDDTLARMPVNLELEQLRGRYGRTVSALRPAGITEFDGRRIDTMSEGDMIPPGQWVRCTDVRAGKVVVRQVDRPPDLANMETTDLQ
jgi:membrane-bound serine protease (ClpP class)